MLFICYDVDEEFRVLVIPGHTKVPEVKKEIKRARRQASNLVTYLILCAKSF